MDAQNLSPFGQILQWVRDKLNNTYPLITENGQPKDLKNLTKSAHDSIQALVENDQYLNTQFAKVFSQEDHENFVKLLQKMPPIPPTPDEIGEADEYLRKLRKG
jgi:hypothetical protein